MTCINCGCTIGQQFTFQGVVICGDCYKMVSHFVQHAKNEFQMMFLTYTDMLRVALVRGQLRPPRMPERGAMPAAEFMQAFQDQVRRMIHADGTKEAKDGEAEVQGVRSDESHPG